MKKIGSDGGEIPCRETKANNTTYECGSVPNSVGPHTVNTTYGGENGISISSIKVNAEPSIDISKLHGEDLETSRWIFSSLHIRLKLSCMG